MTDKPVNVADLEALLRWADLDVAREEQAAMMPHLKNLTMFVAALDAVHAEETPPQSAFDPRWSGHRG